MKLAEIPEADKKSFLPQRLKAALEGVCRKGSGDGLEDDLRFLSDIDAGRAHASHAMVRIIIWAIPILGFLGTVIGITMAIAGLDPKMLENRCRSSPRAWAWPSTLRPWPWDFRWC